MDAASFTEVVRQELGQLDLGGDREVHAELAAVVRLAGSLTMSGGGRGDRRFGLEVATSSGAVARRTFALLQRRYGLRAELLVRAPGGVRRRSTYGVRLGTGAARVAADLGVLDERGRLAEGSPPELTGRRAAAHLRGAVLAAGSVSAPGRDPHLEIVCGSEGHARGLAELLDRTVAGHTVVTAGRRPRLVVKSGERIGELLAVTGATSAFLAWDEQRLRRQLRGEATRLANADAANLTRSVEAARVQVETVVGAVERVGWDGLDPELRAVALARLANPDASLAEVGQLVTPPVGKSAVHRRFQRLERLAAGEDEAATRPQDP
jgi:cell division protein WhiA